MLRQNKNKQTLHIGGRSSIRNLRTRHAVVTGTHLSRNLFRDLYANFISSDILKQNVTDSN
jgi:hypothetical protein